ncbi:MAG TPA: DNA polymerase III subunit chi [Gammaproteobacteria bacterium]|nr:DNA polymerase III subunit chi [Gammaproteobacteria bacterium]
MTQVDFHILESEGPDRAMHHACRLINKAYMQGHRLHVRVTDASYAEQLDKLLWSFSDQSFVPHELQGTGDATPAPVNISIMGDSPEPDVILVNLCDNMPETYRHHERLIEIVAGDPDSTTAARERYRQYRESGDTLEIYKIK